MSTDDLVNSVRGIVQKNKDLLEGYDRLKTELAESRADVTNLQTRLANAGKLVMELRKFVGPPVCFFFHKIY
jgi:cell division septum initiation protein DivIVA